MNKVEEIKNLIEKLNWYRDSYYNFSVPLVSDYEYDCLFDDLKRLENETGVIFANSPTQTVGFEVKSNLEKVVHSHPMLSLDKTKSIKELKNFLGNKLGIMMLKMDGLTISLHYSKGKLVSAETRGNGEIGENILHNARVFENIPLEISFVGELTVDGEAIITYDDFGIINKQIENPDEKYKNPRNLVSGSVRQLDSRIAKSRHIKFIAWKLVNCSYEHEHSFRSQLSALAQLGFTVVPYVSVAANNDIKMFETIINYLKNTAEIKGFPIDGMVLGYDDIDYGNSLGATGHHLKSQIAYKFYDEETETRLMRVDWTMGKSGTLTPTVVFEPVEISGSTIERASLHNVSILKDLDLCYDDMITVYKANDIIPQIRDNLSKYEHDEKSLRLYIPDSCPYCGSDTKILKNNDSEILVCTNPNCDGKKLYQLCHFVSKNAMNIDGLSENTLCKFIHKGWINSFNDIFTVVQNHYNEIVDMIGFGEKSADRLITNIDVARNTTLDRFIYALCIPMIGRTASKTISEYFNGDFEKFYNKGLVGNFDWTVLNDFGDSMSNSIKTFVANSDMQMLLELGRMMNFQKPTISNNANTNNLSGMKFVITGSLNTFANRDKAKEKIESLGGKVIGSVSKNTTYLVNNDINSTSGKNKKAKELRIPIITEEELINILNN